MDFDIAHRDCYESLHRASEMGGARLIVTSPPYPEARTDEQYGASFDTTVEGYGKLGDACFEALQPGGVCVLNIDGPIRVWRPELGESERSLIAFKVAIDWAERTGFRYLEHGAYLRHGMAGRFGPRWRSGWEPVHVFARPGDDVYFDPAGYTVPAKTAGLMVSGGRGRTGNGWASSSSYEQPETRGLVTAFGGQPNQSGHPAPFSRVLSDAYVLCYSQPGDLVCDPFLGSGTVTRTCHRHGRRFVGGDFGVRVDGRRWSDLALEAVRQQTLF